MEKKKNLFTSEAVSIGHPDHVCDMISDSVLDECLKQDKNARVACETMAKDEFVILSGEISTTANINIEQIVKDTIKKIGYTYTPRVLNLISKQSPDIAQGVDIRWGSRPRHNVWICKYRNTTIYATSNYNGT